MRYILHIYINGLKKNNIRICLLVCVALGLIINFVTTKVVPYDLVYVFGKFTHIHRNLITDAIVLVTVGEIVIFCKISKFHIHIINNNITSIKKLYTKRENIYLISIAVSLLGSFIALYTTIPMHKVILFFSLLFPLSLFIIFYIVDISKNLRIRKDPL